MEYFGVLAIICRGITEPPPKVATVSRNTLHPVTELLIALVCLFIVAACGRTEGPRREQIDGIEFVRNLARPLEGEPLPDPREPPALLIVTGGRDDAPAWTAVRDVRAASDSLWAVTDMHLAEVTWFNNRGGPVVSMDLSRPPMGLTSPVASAFDTGGTGTTVDMGLRRVIRFDGDGNLLASFEVRAGLPGDLDIGTAGEVYVLTSARPFGAQEQIIQVRVYSAGGTQLQVAGEDSLGLAHLNIAEIDHPLPVSMTVGPKGVLYAAASGYRVHQVLPDGSRRVIIRAPTSSRVPGYVLDLRRLRMQRRVPAQQSEVLLTEETEIVHIVAVDEGGVIVQTNEWHPALLAELVAEEVGVVLLDRFSQDGTLLHRYAVELPFPRSTIHITDEAGGYLYGYAVPTAGSGPVSAFRFGLPPAT